VTIAVQQPQGGVTAPHPAAAALEDCGLLDPSEAPYAVVHDHSRAHPVWLVRLPDGCRLVVKTGYHHGGPDLAVECFVYRMTVWCEPLADALPEALVIDEDHQLLILADVNDRESAGSLAQQVGFPPAFYSASYPVPEPPSSAVLADLTRGIGYALGRLHRATAGFPLPAGKPPLVLTTLGPARTSVAEPMAAAISVLGAHPQLRHAADEMARPVRGCLVNHDLKWDNIVLQRSARGVRPRLLDWELAGLGDPAWDLGCLLAEHQVRSVTPANLDQPAQALLSGYAAGALLRTEVAEAFSRRVVLAAGLRIAQLGLEVAYTPGSVTPDAVDRLAKLAAGHLNQLPDLTAEVMRCLY
jgi:hypothetical protein